MHYAYLGVFNTTISEYAKRTANDLSKLQFTFSYKPPQVRAVVAAPTPVFVQRPIEKYPWHTNIPVTMFWVGEGATTDNGFIHNSSSAWVTDWISAFGGIDDPSNRCDYKPCGVTLYENPFYFALPYNDYQDNGQLKSNLSVIPWYKAPPPAGSSLIKNQWIEVKSDTATVYAQWQDAGPFGENDEAYVFGTAGPSYQAAGLDLSPAAMNVLGLNGYGRVSWRFIAADEVPKGPWSEIITTSGLHY